MMPRSTARRIALAVTVGLVLAGGAAAPQAQAAATSTVFVNEIHYDNVGTDTGEFVEVAGPAGTDLTGWSVVLYNGSGGAPYDTTLLTGTIPDQQNGYGTVSIGTPGLQNGSPDGLALVRPDNTVEQFLSYEGSFTAVGGPADGITSVDIGVSESSSTPVGGSLGLTGTGLLYGDFGWAPMTETPGAVNAGQVFDGGVVEPPPSECGEPATLIHDIQGDGLVFDPGFGGTQTVEGVVVDVVSGGMHVEEEAADQDGNPATSEGIFVFLAGQAPPAVGATVRATGTVTEFGSNGSITELTQAVFETCATTSTITATPVTFPVSSATGLEAYESMLVSFPQDLVISEYFNYDRFGEVVAGVPPNGWSRFYTPTAVADPGAAAQALADDYARRRITIDDRSSAQNPSVIPHPGNGRPFALDNRFRGGDTITGIEGVVENSFGVYRLQPTRYGAYAPIDPRPTGAPGVGGSVKVASANVLNYFLTLDAGSPICGPLQDQGCRGADNATELVRQRDKIVASLVGLEADVIGLMEMENSPGVEPAADLVDGLNATYGPGTYAYVDTGVIGSDAIRVGLIYRADTVRPAGDFAILDSSVDPRFDDTRSRPMLTQTFDEILTGGRFTVSVNHLKSKGSPCDGDPDTGDGQGNCSATRTAAAAAIADYLAADPTHSGDPDQLVIGDLNAYDHEDPITTLASGGFSDQLRRFQGDLAYSYVFDGQNGYLDHALAGRSLARQVVGADIWHINADEPDILDYDTSFKPPAIDALYEPNAYRASDHDPVVVGLAPARVTPRACYADGAQTVSSYSPGTKANGHKLGTGQSRPENALGLPGHRSRGTHWTSLGIGGELVLRFDRPIQNNNGSAADLRVYDARDGRKGRTDSADVWTSWDGGSWVYAGSVAQTGTVDLGALQAARYVKLVDTTPVSRIGGTDGYDVDAVEVLTGCVGDRDGRHHRR